MGKQVKTQNELTNDRIKWENEQLANSTKSQSALATTPPASAGGIIPADQAERDELAQLAGLGDDGLSEVGADDVRIPSYAFNMKMLDKNGDPVPLNTFYDTVAETTKKRVRAVLLITHKTNAYAPFNQDKGKNELYCISHDLKHGTWQSNGQQHPAGLVRPCKSCPDAQWRREEKDGKVRNVRDCSPVHNVLASDLDEGGKLFMIRFKRSGRKPFIDHINKHHIGKIRSAESSKNIPLYVFEVALSLKMSDDATHAVPVIERGRVITRAEAVEMAATMAAMAARMREASEVATVADADGADHAEGADGAGRERRPTQGEYVSGQGSDFVE